MGQSGSILLRKISYQNHFYNKQKLKKYNILSPITLLHLLPYYLLRYIEFGMNFDDSYQIILTIYTFDNV